MSKKAFDKIAAGLNEALEVARGEKTVWIYQGKELKVFATAEAAQAWFDENDPEGVAFEYPVEK